MSTSDKLIYLNGTKQALKESINNIGGDITSETTFREYAQELDNIYDNLPKTTGEDTNLSLTTLKGKMNIIPKGDTQQTQYSGYNKMNTTNATIGYKPEGTTITIDSKGVINASTNVNYASINLPNMTLSSGKTYTFKRNFTGSYNTYLVDTNGENILVIGYNATSKTITPESDITINKLNGALVSGDNYFWLYEGTTDKSFEPFVGNTASPNPTYPQDIEVVTGTQEVKVENKNLFVCRTDITIGQSGTRNGITWKRTGENTFLFNGTATADFTFIIDKPSHLLENLRKGDTYTLSGCPSGGSSSTYRLQIYHSNLTSTTIDTGEGKPFTANIQSESNVAILIYNGYTANNLEFNVQIEKGSTKTEFQPHQEQTQIVELSSKNILPLNQADFTTTFYGVGIEVKSQVVKISGTPTDNISIMIGKNGVVTPTDNDRITFQLKSGTYKFTQFITGSSTTNVDIRLKDENTNIFYKTGATITLSETHTFAINILILGTDNKNAEIKAQLEEGSSASEYEEYYNYELCKIGNYQDYLYKTSGKNKFNGGTETKSAYPSTSVGSAVSYNNSSATYSYVNCAYLEQGKTYTISWVKNTPANTGGRDSVLVDNNDVILEVFSNLWIDSITSKTITPTHSGYIVLAMDKNSTNIMLNEGSTALPYEPYGSGEWYKKEYIGKTILTNSGWALYQTKTKTCRFVTQNYTGNIAPKKNTIVLSNYFKGYEGNTTIGNIDDNGVAPRDDEMGFTLQIDKTLASDITTLYSWLSTHNTEVYYALATANDIQITNETLIEQLDNLEKLKSYNGVTNINCSGNLSAILGVSAIKGES